MSRLRTQSRIKQRPQLLRHHQGRSQPDIRFLTTLKAHPDGKRRSRRRLPGRRQRPPPLTWILIQKSEQPQRNLVAEAEFDVICRDETVGNIANLREPFSFAANLKKISVVNNKVSIFGKSDPILTRSFIPFRNSKSASIGPTEVLTARFCAQSA